MTEPHEEFNKFQKDLEATEEFMRKAIEESLEKNSKDWGRAMAWASHSVNNIFADAQSPESEIPDTEELVMLELGKLQWINMQILNELRKKNG